MKLKKVFTVALFVAVAGLIITLLDKIEGVTGNLTSGNVAFADSIGFLFVIIGTVLLIYVFYKIRKRSRILEVDMNETDPRKDLENF